jgi:hypothetical protein
VLTAHRIVVDQGRLIEQEGLYARLAALQFDVDRRLAAE